MTKDDEAKEEKSENDALSAQKLFSSRRRGVSCHHFLLLSLILLEGKMIWEKEQEVSTAGVFAEIEWQK